MVRVCIVIPTYCESLSIPHLVNGLDLVKNKDIAIVIADDSPPYEREFLIEYLHKENEKYSSKRLYLVEGDVKGGRGAAVKRGMEFALKNFQKCNLFIECDADSSHSSEDILKLSCFEGEWDLIIGSRYLPDSKILNWPFTRVVFSRLLNLLLPKWFHLEVSDITNGLRRYSRKSAEVICEQPNLIPGFLYLTEQLLILKDQNLELWSEIPIVFSDRTRGNSSVTFRDLINSLKAAYLLSKAYK